MKNIGRTARILAILGLALSTPTTHAQALDDAAIIGIYNQVNSIDIEIALLGQVKGHAPAVRALASMVATDHSGVRKAVDDIARRLNITPRLPAGRAAFARTHYETVERLRSLSGADFDRAYLQHERAFHSEALGAVRDVLMPSASQGELRSHFEAVLPHFLHHLNETIRVSEELGIK